MVHVMAVPLPARAKNPATTPGRVSPGHPDRGTAALLLIGWSAVAVGIGAGDGRGPWPLVFVLAGWIAVLLAAAGLADRLRRRAWHWHGAAWTGLAGVLAVGVALRPRYYAAGRWADVSDALGVAAGLLTAGSLLLRAHPSTPTSSSTPTSRRRAARRLASPACFWPVVGLVVGAGVAMILASPAPRIDVFHLLQVSGRGLLDGADMYRQQWAPSRAEYPVYGLFDVYPYLPGTTLLLAPFRLLLGDVRYGLLFALVLAAVAIRRIAGAIAPDGDGDAETDVPAALPLVVLVFPGSMYALQQSWTEPLLVACLAGMVWAVRAGRTGWAVAAFALALASKQHLALLVPVAAVWPAFGPRRVLVAAAAAAALVAPWVLAGPADFWADAVMTNLRYPVRGDSLSIPGVLVHAGVRTGFAPMLLALAGAYWLAWRARSDAAGFCVGAAVVLLTLDVMNKQSYFNHYTLPMALLVMTLSLRAVDRPLGDTGISQGIQESRVDQRRVENRSSEAPS
ncbi:hypothetical protein FDG2_3602 [Candidatus Protofrankia californiensis]|uniref:DUF2029 domain-containing protein n=1 Tax=Candidatus Protofrankia californiensis TaxID=1839754 RepID=A0A1C3NZY7_9ACTN|nr:hypothetical protein FDG2_3602 [Candidatus Protofrankia californiensis]